MYCLKCGKEIANDVKTCPFCGCVTENAEIDANVSLEQNNENASNNTLATTGIVLAVIGIVMAWILAFIGYAISTGALVVALVARSKNKANKKANLAFILSLVAFACCIISSIVGVIMMS